MLLRIPLKIALATLVLSASSMLAQTPTQIPAAQQAKPKFDAFDVATIKAVGPDEGKGRYITMQGTHRFVAKDYTLKLLIAAAYDLNPKTISGGPSWVESDPYNILAESPGETRPSHDEQMAMLRSLISDRFKLTFHRESREFSIFELQLTKGGPKLKPPATSDQPPAVGPAVVYPQRVVLTVHNATMGDFTSLLQRAILDRPVIDKTGLTGRYDFELEWAPDETQFGGAVPVAPADAPAAPLFRAIQDQLGLRLVATRGPVDALIVNTAERPTAD